MDKKIRIWIRHSHKEYPNGKGPAGKPQHDPGILRYDISYLHGILPWPDLILVSPYKRTRETVEQLFYNLPRESPIIRFDSRISEYLGHQKARRIEDNGKIKLTFFPDVEYDTWVSAQKSIHLDDKHSVYPLPLLEEKRHQFNDRVLEHFNDVIHRPEPIIWIVTHGLCIKCIENSIDIKRQHKLKPLSGLKLVQESEKSYIEYV